MIGFIYGMTVEYHYKGSMPTSPTKERGLELHVDHGKRVFVSQAEWAAYEQNESVLGISIAVALTGAFAYAYLLRIAKPTDKMR